MTSELFQKYQNYLSVMWQENCIERDAWGDKPLTREEYVAKNKDWITDQFYYEEMKDKVWNGKEYVNP